MNTKALLISIALLTGSITVAQTPAPPQPAAPPSTVVLKGCVTQIPNVPDAHVIATGDRCILLSGKYKPAQIAGHEVTLIGTLTEASGAKPITLEVTSTKNVSNACSQTCTLPPPGHRGIHGGEKAGHEGGTAGAVPREQQNPQQPQ